MKRNLGISIISFLVLILFGCKKDNDTETSTTTSTAPEIYNKIYGASSVYVEGDYVVIKTIGLPDHNSPYYQNTQWSNKYEAYNGSVTFNQNPNKIGSQSYTFKIPLNPTVASTSQATSLGPMGVCINGVPFFNQYAGPNNQPLTNEILSFDQYGGHPDQGSRYHYHLEPYYVTNQKGSSALIGFLLDGFPIYGPSENGVAVLNSDLDVYHGHTHATTEYPNGIYHYHITSESPYINGSGYYGTAGTVSY